jgi:hypothetical protein
MPGTLDPARDLLGGDLDRLPAGSERRRAAEIQGNYGVYIHPGVQGGFTKC